MGRWDGHFGCIWGLASRALWLTGLCLAQAVVVNPVLAARTVMCAKRMAPTF